MTYLDGLGLVAPVTDFRMKLLDGSTNLLIALCYFIIGVLLSSSLWRCHRQQGVEVMGMSMAIIFLSCALCHAAQGIGLLGIGNTLSWQFSFDLITLIAAIAFLSFYRNYGLFVCSTQTLESNAELKQLNIALKGMLESRTQELWEQNHQFKAMSTELQRMQRHLVQTEKMSMLGQMVAGISHEINNPINFIYGNLPHIEDHVQDLLEVLHSYESACPADDLRVQAVLSAVDLEFVLKDLPRVVNSMKLGAERIRELVSNLRHFYRLDEPQMKPADLQTGIENTLILLQNRYKQDIQIDRQFDEIPLVECHINQLSQVFMNLISNAIDALMEQKEENENKQILITTQQLDSDWVMIKISDNGPGILPEVQLKLFEPFFTTKPMGVGTGLGLSISYQIVTETHQGRISCFSTLGGGTTFTVELPICQSQVRDTKVSLDRQTCVSC